MKKMSFNDDMATFHDFTTAQLKQAVQIREQIEGLQAKLDALLGGTTKTKQTVGRQKGKRTMSTAGRANIAAAVKARWAKLKGKSALQKSSPATASPKKKGMSSEARAKIAAAMKARWAAKKKASDASAK